MRNLGKALGIVAREEAHNAIMHMDVDVMYAPSECHNLVARGRIKRQREARRHAKAVSGLNRRLFRKALDKNIHWAMVCAERIIARDCPF